MVDALAQEYDQARLPVLFLEQWIRQPQGNRMDRWYDAYDQRRTCGVPLVTVDSGWRWTCGSEDFATVYRAMVDAALANPPDVDLSGHYVRSGSSLDVWLEVTNRSGLTLGADNSATANAIVFERTKVIHTERFVRAAADQPLITGLPNGQKGSYAIHLGDVAVGDWSKAVVVVLLDYQPTPGVGHYESLQAAIAVELPPASPTPLASATPTATATWTATPTASGTETPTRTPTAMTPTSATATSGSGSTATSGPQFSAYVPLVTSRPR